MPGGRPTKYKKKYCKEIVEMQSEGMSLHEVAAEWNIDVDTIWEWKASIPEFFGAFTRARAKLRAWYDKTARDKIVDVTIKGDSSRLNDRTLKFLYYINFRESENSLNSCVNLPELYYKSKDITVKQEILDQQLALNKLTSTQYDTLSKALQLQFDRTVALDNQRKIEELEKKMENQQ